MLTILDNTTTHVFDTVAAVNFDPPAQAPEYPLDPSQFAARSNFPYSTVWVPGNQVQYAVSFVYETGETALGPYSGWSTVGPFEFPLLSGVPCSKDIRTAGKNYPGCIARKIYRSAQAPGAGGTMVPIETGVLVATISNNTDTTAQDPPALWSSSVSTVALAQTARG